MKSLYLFRSLTKDGCKWHGDVLSSKWSDCLYFDESVSDKVARTLESYIEGIDYKLETGAVWIA